MLRAYKQLLSRAQWLSRAVRTEVAVSGQQRGLIRRLREKLATVPQELRAQLLTAQEEREKAIDQVGGGGGGGR